VPAECCHVHASGSPDVVPLKARGGIIPSNVEAGADAVSPETCYARSGDVHIAYQVVGEGPVDLVFAPGWVSHVEHGWEEPSFAPFLERLASFSRLILLDRRGTGLSDPVHHLPTLEERMDDLRAAMDAAGSEQAVLFGISESGPMAALFAAAHPERTVGLVLCNSFACGKLVGDTPAEERERTRAWISSLPETWGTGITPGIFAPSRADDQAFVNAWARFERRAASPGSIENLMTIAMSTDVRDVLPSVHVPTLVIHRREERAIPIEEGRFLAERIPDARLVEVPGIDHFPWVGDTDSILDEVEHFVTGARPEIEPDRILATVLFIDIVDSTRHLAEQGDRRWREHLEHYYRAVRDQLDRFHGREIDRAGDGLFATFDGPARAIRCAAAVREAVSSQGLGIRAGVHTGECEVIGKQVSGIAVHLGARVCASAEPGEVRVSSTVKDLVAGSGLDFVDRGEHVLKGIPGEWRLFAATA
jgi:pimeloyl-ACP methyl ester carboxylesterase